MAEMKKKKSNFSLRKLIYNDKYLIIISVIAAIVIWIATSMNLSPETTKTVTVPVTADFSDSAAAKLGIKCYGDETFDVDVTVSCKKYLAKDITSDDIDVSLQTNVVGSTGNIEVPIKVTTGENADFDVQSYYPTTYKGFFDVEDKKELPIEISYSNDDFIESGYIMGEPLLSSETAIIKGPKSYVSKVKKVISNVSINERLKSTQSYDITLSAVDSNSTEVEYVSVDTDPAGTTLTIPVLKQLELDVSTTFEGKPKRLDTSDFSVSYSVNRVNAGVLEDADISTANIGTIDFSQLNVGRNSFDFKTDSIDGLIVLDSIDTITAVVNVPSNYEKKEIKVNRNSVKITNVPKGYKASTNAINFTSVTVIGTAQHLADINQSNINFTVDLSPYSENIKTGVLEYSLTASLENADNCWIYGKYSANLSVIKE